MKTKTTQNPEAPDAPEAPADAQVRDRARSDTSKAAKSGPGGDAGDDSAELPLPHERDQSAGQVESEPDAVIEQAKRDLDAGQVDTDLRATPGLDAERRDSLVRNPR